MLKFLLMPSYEMQKAKIKMQNDRAKFMINPKHEIRINSKSEILNPKQSRMTKIQNTKTVLNLEFRVLDLFRV